MFFLNVCSFNIFPLCLCAMHMIFHVCISVQVRVETHAVEHFAPGKYKCFIKLMFIVY